MTPQEALQAIIAVLPNVENFDEHLETITAAISNDNSEVEDWKKRYEELEATYRKRFIENLETPIDTPKELEEPKEDEEKITIEALDFNADSE